MTLLFPISKPLIGSLLTLRVIWICAGRKIPIEQTRKLRFSTGLMCLKKVQSDSSYAEELVMRRVEIVAKIRRNLKFKIFFEFLKNKFHILLKISNIIFLTDNLNLKIK